MVTVGGKVSNVKSRLYKLRLLDQQGKPVDIEVIGIDKISSPIMPTNLNEIARILQINPKSINRPLSGEIEVLIGLQYAAFHPERIKREGHLTLYQNRFGRAVGGYHPLLSEGTIIEDECALVRLSLIHI